MGGGGVHKSFKKQFWEWRLQTRNVLFCIVKFKNKDCPVLTTKNGDFVLDRENDNVDNRFHKNDSLHPPLSPSPLTSYWSWHCNWWVALNKEDSGLVWKFGKCRSAVKYLKLPFFHDDLFISKLNFTRCYIEHAIACSSFLDI